MKRFIVIGVIMCIIIALGLGVWLGGGSREPSTYELERTAMSLQVSRSLVPFQVAFRVLLGGVVLFTIWRGGRGTGPLDQPPCQHPLSQHMPGCIPFVRIASARPRFFTIRTVHRRRPRSMPTACRR